MNFNLPKIIEPYTGIIRNYTIKRFESAGISYRLRATIHFNDYSVLHVRETVIEGKTIKYSYHWQDRNDEMIIRWDNAPDWENETFPHHRHIGEPNKVEPSFERTFEQVLKHIASAMKSVF